MPEYITTFSGSHFYPMRPDADAIHIRDIAHALPMICRGNGHVNRFFSVGQHCIFCAREAEARGHSVRTILACLLHDAGECYMSDVPRPFKQQLPRYNELEDMLLEIIYTKYLFTPLTEEERASVRAIDDDLLYYDLTVLLNEPKSDTPPKIYSSISYDFVPFESVTEQYLALFYHYAAIVALNFAQERILTLPADTISNLNKIASHSLQRAEQLGYPVQTVNNI